MKQHTNSVNMTAVLATEPTIRTGSQGGKYVTVKVAVDDGGYNLSAITFRDLKDFHQGTRVSITGYLESRTWKSPKGNHPALQLVIREISRVMEPLTPRRHD
ncbi:MAG: single-stranded DNA-binding protein [Terriglobales bacterium]